MGDGDELNLKDIVLRKTIVLLCASEETRQRLICDPLQEFPLDPVEIIGFTLSKLLLPPEIKNELIEAIRRIFLPLTKVTKMHPGDLCSMCNCFRETCLFFFFCYSRGIFDEQQIVKRIVQMDNFTVMFRFILSLKYELRKDEYILFLQIPMHLKRRMLDLDFSEGLKFRIRTILLKRKVAERQVEEYHRAHRRPIFKF